MGGGGFALAESYVRRYPDLEADPTFGLFLSRRDPYAGDFASRSNARQAAVAAHPADSGTHLSHLALANLATISFGNGRLRRRVDIAEELVSLDPSPGSTAIARGDRATSVAARRTETSTTSAPSSNGALAMQARRGPRPLRGISHLNLAYYAVQRGRRRGGPIHCRPRRWSCCRHHPRAPRSTRSSCIVHRPSCSSAG